MKAQRPRTNRGPREAGGRAQHGALRLWPRRGPSAERSAELACGRPRCRRGTGPPQPYGPCRAARPGLTWQLPPGGSGGGSERSGCASHSNRRARARRRLRDRIARGGDIALRSGQSAPASTPGAPPVANPRRAQWAAANGWALPTRPRGASPSAAAEPRPEPQNGGERDRE